MALYKKVFEITDHTDVLLSDFVFIGVKVHCLCLELAVSQCRHQSTAALCVATWLTPTLFVTLKVIIHLFYFKV